MDEQQLRRAGDLIDEGVSAFEAEDTHPDRRQRFRRAGDKSRLMDELRAQEIAQEVDPEPAPPKSFWQRLIARWA